MELLLYSCSNLNLQAAEVDEDSQALFLDQMHHSQFWWGELFVSSRGLGLGGALSRFVDLYMPKTAHRVPFDFGLPTHTEAGYPAESLR